MSHSAAHIGANSKAQRLSSEEAWQFYDIGRKDGHKAGFTQREKMEQFVFDQGMVRATELVRELIRLMTDKKVPFQRVFMRVGEIGVHELAIVVDSGHYCSENFEADYEELWDYVDQADVSPLQVILGFISVGNPTDLDEELLIADGFSFEYNLNAENDSRAH